MKSFLLLLIIYMYSLPAAYAQFLGGSSDGFAMGSYGGTGSELVLPIELISFSAVCENNALILKWSTASETNNSYFTIEKSTDKTPWEIVNLIGGAGNSLTTITYSYKDTEPVDATTYYRLMQTDFDGKNKYSNSISVNNCQEKLTKLTIYPNPSNGKFEIQSNNLINTVYIINSLGNVVYQQQAIHAFAASIDISQLPKNIYQLTVHYQNKTIYKRIVVQ